MRKRLMFFGVVCLLAVAVIVVFRASRRPHFPIDLKLREGDVIRITAMTYGTQHVVGPLLAQWYAKVPASLRFLPKSLAPDLRKLRVTVTASPELRIWYECVQSNGNGSRHQCFLGDENGFIAGSDDTLGIIPSGGILGGTVMQSLSFKIFPRRPASFTLHILGVSDWSPRAESVFRLPNPFQSASSSWRPEPLPTVADAGDVKVTLHTLATGYGMGTTISTNRTGAPVVTYETNRSRGFIYYAFQISMTNVPPNRRSDWTVAGVEVSDGSGNIAPATTLDLNSIGTNRFAAKAMPSLWPGEEAWNVKLSIKRKSGFATNELLVLKNILFHPIGEENNHTSTADDGHGIEISLVRCVRPDPSPLDGSRPPNSCLIEIRHSNIPSDTYVDLVGLRIANTNVLIASSSSLAGPTQRYAFRDIPPDAKSADMVFSVQKARTVEFKAKPRNVLTAFRRLMNNSK